MNPQLMVFAGIALVGAVLMVAAMTQRHVAPDVADFLEGLGYSETDQKLAEPLSTRLMRGAGTAVSSRVEKLLPGPYLQKLDRQLAQAGMTGKRSAGGQLAIQVGLGAAGLVLGPFVPAGSPRNQVLTMILLPVMGFVLPAARLKKKVRQRSEVIFKDLPDVVDMLAIAVEAGSGFESALSLVCQNFHSPLTDEFGQALKEMELGLPRKEAFQQMRDRIDLDVVRALMLALLQADALGIPISRVLKTQATEVRARRRAWAREKAAKLPIKIMFPLVLFIFPPILALVIGPAAGSFGKLGN